jgi:Flp pilus assembly protein TadB
MLPSRAVSDDFTTFRAAHPSALDAIAACDRPDWLVQLAWEVADHKNAVRIGLGAAQLSSRASDTLWLFNPNPNRLETVAAWAGDDGDAVERSSAVARALSLAGVPAVALSYGIATVFVPGSWYGIRALWFVVSILVLEMVFTVAVRRSLAAIVRRRAAQLDERAALDIVLDEVRKGTAANPQLVPIVLKSTGSRLRRFLNAGESQ